MYCVLAATIFCAEIAALSPSAAAFFSRSISAGRCCVWLPSLSALSWLCPDWLLFYSAAAVFPRAPPLLFTVSAVLTVRCFNWLLFCTQLPLSSLQSVLLCWFSSPLLRLPRPGLVVLCLSPAVRLRLLSIVISSQLAAAAVLLLLFSAISSAGCSAGSDIGRWLPSAWTAAVPSLLSASSRFCSWLPFLCFHHLQLPLLSVLFSARSCSTIGPAC